MTGYEIEPRAAHTPVTAPAPIATLDQRIRYAEKLAQAGLLPAAYRNRPANVLVAIETGAMFGMAPMAAISNVHVIEGKPSYSAGLLAALVRRAGHRFRLTGDDTHAVAEIVRSDDPDFVFRSEWTIERARRAGLLGKDNWKRYPAAMLKARATSEVCRDAAQDVFLGPVYVPEELGAEVDADGDPINGEVVDPHPDRDWTAAIEECAGDADQLRDLYYAARDAGAPAAVIEQITAAGQAAAAEQDQTSTGDSEPLDAEVVDPPAPRPTMTDADWDAAREALVQEGAWQQLEEMHAAAKVAGASPAVLHRIARDAREVKQAEQAREGGDA